jgi:hypothetical protein
VKLGTLKVQTITIDLLDATYLFDYDVATRRLTTATGKFVYTIGMDPSTFTVGNYGNNGSLGKNYNTAPTFPAVLNMAATSVLPVNGDANIVVPSLCYTHVPTTITYDTEDGIPAGTSPYVYYDTRITPFPTKEQWSVIINQPNVQLNFRKQLDGAIVSFFFENRRAWAYLCDFNDPQDTQSDTSGMGLQGNPFLKLVVVSGNPDISGLPHVTIRREIHAQLLQRMLCWAKTYLTFYVN